MKGGSHRGSGRYDGGSSPGGWGIRLEPVVYFKIYNIMDLNCSRFGVLSAILRDV